MSLSRFFVPKQLNVTPSEMELCEKLQGLQDLLLQEYNFWSFTSSKTTVDSINNARAFLAGLMNAFFEDSNQFLRFLSCFEGKQFQNLIKCVRCRKGASVHEQEQAGAKRRRFKNDIKNVITTSYQLLKSKDDTVLQQLLQRSKDDVLSGLQGYIADIEAFDPSADVEDSEVSAEQPAMYI